MVANLRALHRRGHPANPTASRRPETRAETAAAQQRGLVSVAEDNGVRSGESLWADNRCGGVRRGVAQLRAGCGGSLRGAPRKVCGIGFDLFHEDAVFYDPKGGVFRGRDEIDRIAGVLKATHPDFEYQPLFPPEELSRGIR